MGFSFDISFERDVVRRVSSFERTGISFEHPRSNETSNDLTVQTRSKPRSNETSNELAVWFFLDCFDFWSSVNLFEDIDIIPQM